MSQRPLLCIVLESAEPDLIERWIRSGDLPQLARLRAEGSWARIASPSEISSGCAWPTLSNGTNPGKHGIGFFHREIENGTYHIIKKYADQVLRRSLLVPARGGRAEAPDLRSPHDAADALQPRHDGGGLGQRASRLAPLVEPPGAHRGDLRAGSVRHPLADWYQSVPDDVAEFARGGPSDRRWRRAAHPRPDRAAGPGASFDAVIVNYAEPHWAGHMFWHLHDEAHPYYEAECGFPLWRRDPRHLSRLRPGGGGADRAGFRTPT